MSKFAGKSSSVLKDGVSIGMAEFELETDNEDVDSMDYDSGGFAEWLAGVNSGTITMSGPLNSGTLGISQGTNYTVKLVFGGSGVSEVSFSCTAKCSNIKRKSKVKSKEAVGITIKWTITGSFTTSVT